MFPLSNDLRGTHKGDEKCEDLDNLHFDRKIPGCLWIVKETNVLCRG